MPEYFELKESYIDENGNIVDIYEHTETGERLEKRPGDTDE